MYMLRKTDILGSVEAAVSGIHKMGVLECVTILSQLNHTHFTFKNTDSGSNKSLTQSHTPRCGSNNLRASGPEAAVPGTTLSYTAPASASVFM